MRGGSRSGQACAFIRFTTPEGAIAAIQAIHGKYVMPGCSDPLVVRYADAPGSRVKKGAARGVQSGPAGYPGMGFGCGYPGGAGGYAANSGGCFGGPSAFGQIAGPMGGGVGASGLGHPGYGQLGQLGGYGGGAMGAMGATGMPGCCGAHLGSCCGAGMGGCGSGGCCASGLGGTQLPGCCAHQCGMGGQCCCTGQCAMGPGGSMPTGGLLNPAAVGGGLGGGASGLGGGLGGVGLGSAGLGAGGGYAGSPQSFLSLHQSALQQQGYGSTAQHFALGLGGGNSGSPIGSPHGSCLQLNLLAQQQSAPQGQSSTSSARQSPPLQSSPSTQTQQPTQQMLQQLQSEQQGQGQQMGMISPSGSVGSALSMYGIAQSLPSLSKLGVSGGQQAGQHARAAGGGRQCGMSGGNDVSGGSTGSGGGGVGNANLMMGGTPVEGLKDWAAYIAPDGRTYYYNSRTGISTWDRPTRDDFGIPGIGFGGTGRIGESSMLRNDSASSFSQF